MHSLKTRVHFWQLLCSGMQRLACNQTNFLGFFSPFIFVWREEGHTYLQAKDVFWEQRMEITSASLRPFLFVTNSVWRNYKPFIHILTWFRLCFFLFIFLMKGSSACYHKRQRVLTVTAGDCSGKEVNDQQSTAAIVVQMDASVSNTVGLANHESTVLTRGGTAGMEGQREGSAAVLNDYMGLKLLGWGGGGKQEADAWMIHKQEEKRKKVSCVYQRIWVWTAIIMWCWCAWVQKNTSSNLHF